MALDVYVGSLTRYYAGEWENVSERTARERGAQYQHRASRRARPTRARISRKSSRRFWPGASSSASRSATASPRRSTGTRHLEAPYFTGRPGWDGFGSLVLWAAYAEHPALRRPASLPEEWDNDPALVRSNVAGFRSRYSHLVRNVELWLPSPFEFTFEGEDVDGRRVVVGSTTTLRRQLEDLNAATWKADAETVAGWGREPLADEAPLELLRALCLRRAARSRRAGGRAQTADEARLLTTKNPSRRVRGRGGERALVGGGCGRRRLGGGRAVAPLVHELVELGAVLGGAQPVEEVAELALLLVELAQRLLAIFVEGDVAAALAAPAMAAAPGAELVARFTAAQSGRRVQYQWP